MIFSISSQATVPREVMMLDGCCGKKQECGEGFALFLRDVPARSDSLDSLVTRLNLFDEDEN